MLTFCANSSKHLEPLLKKVGFQIGKIERYNFSDGELYLRIKNDVRGQRVLIVGSTEAPAENLLELIFLTQAVLENGGRPEVFIPYFGYARGDKIENSGEGHRLKQVCALLNTLGAPFKVLDAHSPAVFEYLKNAKQITTMPLLAKRVKKFLKNIKKTIVVAPDYGARERATIFAKHLGTGNILVIKKKRFGPRVKFVKPKADLRGQTVILVDDILDVGGTMFGLAKILYNLGAVRIYAACVHGVFSGQAIKNLAKSKIQKLFITNSFSKKYKSSKIIRIDISELITQ